ncbi:outer membrane protein assembly factor BamD [Candidatus Phycosocius spiralis]|uniref:outer membrane protein assembly factor BamD n=1 Tax=Candidatus Phycosocius spiralis TaxID=2815099 RepID=UPI002A4E2DAD|nr:outer membrane protein assembly factor BamD [Candidatus Phycosocius spiralis]
MARSFIVKQAKYRNLCVVPLFLCLLAACQSGPSGSKSNKAPAYVERPVDLLYNNARDQLSKRNYSEAVTGFEEVDRQHPYSEWARRALLMTAYANYQQNKYEEAIAGAQRFAALYPGNDSAVYAYYLIAICYFEQIVDVGRDQRMTELALAALNDVVQRYPQSEYARDARLKIDMTQDQLAGKEMEIGRYYLREGQHLAALGRFRRVVDLYQTTTHVPEALHRLVETNLSLGLWDEATKVGAVLGYNYPGSEWYEASYKLLTARGISPKIKPQRRSMFQKAKHPKSEVKKLKEPPAPSKSKSRK